MSTVGVCRRRSKGVNLRDPRGRLRVRSVWRLRYVSRFEWSSWANKKEGGFVWKKPEYSSPRGFGCKANCAGTVVLRAWQIGLSGLDLLARRRSGFDCAIQASEFF